MSQFDRKTLKPLLLSLLGATLALSLGAAFWYRTALAEMIINAWQGYKLTDGLVGYWTFDGGDIDLSLATAEIRDRSGQGNHGDWKNHATTTVIGKIGQGISFPGSTDYVTAGNSTAFRFPSGDFTVAFWMKGQYVSQGSGINVVIENGDWCSSSYAFAVDSSNKVVFCRDGASLTSTTAVGDDNWHFVIGRRGGTVREIFIDGVSSGTTTAADMTDSTMTLYFAADPNVSSRNFNGSLDDVRVYNRALSAEEVKRLYLIGGSFKINTSRPYEVAEGLVALWTFDGADMDISSSTREIFDRSGQGNHADWINHATTTIIGKIGQGISFDGVDDGATYGTKISFDSNDFTVSGWIRMNGAAGGSDAHNIIFSQRADATGNGSPTVSLYLSNTQKATFIVRDSVGAAVTAADAATANFGEWYHVVGVKTGSAITLYVNGISVATQAHALSGDFDTNAIHRFLGKNRYSGADQAFLNGSLDDVRVYNRALSAEEVKRLYLMGGSFKINTSRPYEVADGLVGYWTFDGGDVSWSQNKALDRSSQANHGTITSMSTTTAPTIGTVGQGLTFDGSDDFIDLGTPSSLDLSGVNRFTLSAWVFPTSAPNGAAIVAEMFSPTNNTVQYTFGFSNSVGPTSTTQPTVGFYNGAWRSAVEARDIDLNVWSHIVGTWDGTTLRLYRNGVEVAQSTPGGALASANFDKVVIGKRHDTAGTTNFFPGKIDDVRIYNRALSVDEVKRLYIIGQ